MFFYSSLIFFGLDNKLGLSIYFENFSNYLILKYFIALIFSVITIFIIYSFLRKNFLMTKKIFLNFLILVFLINLFMNFNLKNNYEKIKLQNNFLYAEKLKKKNINNNLDETQWHRSTDERINLEVWQKKLYGFI